MFRIRSLTGSPLLCGSRGIPARFLCSDTGFFKRPFYRKTQRERSFLEIRLRNGADAIRLNNIPTLHTDYDG